MCLSGQFLKGPRFAHLQEIEKVSLHALDAHLDRESFRQSNPCFKTNHAPAVDVVHDWFICQLFCVCQLNHAESTLATVESIQKFLVHLPPAVDELRL